MGGSAGRGKGERGLTEAELASTLIGLSNAGGAHGAGGLDRSASVASSSNANSVADGFVPTSQVRGEGQRERGRGEGEGVRGEDEIAM